jgi:hypothetical protein
MHLSGNKLVSLYPYNSLSINSNHEFSYMHTYFCVKININKSRRFMTSNQTTTVAKSMLHSVSLNSIEKRIEELTIELSQVDECSSLNEEAPVMNQQQQPTSPQTAVDQSAAWHDEPRKDEFSLVAVRMRNAARMRRIVDNIRTSKKEGTIHV